MIVRSRIRQSFQRRFGFVLERGDNRFNEPLPPPVARMFEALRRAKLVTLLSEEEYAAEQSPALESAASSQRPKRKRK